MSVPGGECVLPRLYNQAMHELQIPRRFATVFVCGGFGLGGDLANDQEALRRFRRHLKPGGQLLLDVHVPFAAGGNWAYWREEQWRGLPQEWGPPPARRSCADGSELSLMSRVADLDPLSQVITIDMRARRWRAGLLEADERYALKERLYFRDELLMMLTLAGFHDIRVEGDYVHEVASQGSTVLVFVAQAP